jgi:hypothetical protein
MSAAVKIDGETRRQAPRRRYDESWVVPLGGFRMNLNPRRWKRVPTKSCTWQCTFLGELVRLGVLEKAEPPPRANQSRSQPCH